MTARESDPESYVVETGRSRLRNGRREIGQSRYLLTVGAPRAEAEEKARAGLRTLRSAMDWLEDTDEFEEAHAELDRAGRFVRESFGCQVAFDDGKYWQECPVALAHVRVGMSPGMVIGAAECSICHQDPVDCPHITGRAYGDMRCVRVIKEVKEILEVSLVGRPAQPDARIMRQSLDTAEIAAALGDEFVVGTPVSCDRCLSPCRGVKRPFDTVEEAVPGNTPSIEGA